MHNQVRQRLRVEAAAGHGEDAPDPARWDTSNPEKLACRVVEGGVPVSSVRVWEWVVGEGTDRPLLGVSGARHRAMTALSQTLITAGARAPSRVVPMALVDGVCGFSQSGWLRR